MVQFLVMIYVVDGVIHFKTVIILCIAIFNFVSCLYQRSHSKVSVDPNLRAAVLNGIFICCLTSRQITDLLRSGPAGF